jgi:hypothetical protein
MIFKYLLKLPSHAVRSLKVGFVFEYRERQEDGGSRFLSMNIATLLKVEVAGSSETPKSAYKTATKLS